MKATKYLFLLSTVLVLSLAACGAPAEEAPAAEAPAAEAPAADAPAAEAPAAEAPAAGDVVAQFTFTNTGSVEICELYLSPVGTESWGPDQLQQKTIPAGAKFTLNNIPAGMYDAKAVGCAGAGEQVIQLDIKN